MQATFGRVTQPNQDFVADVYAGGTYGALYGLNVFGGTRLGGRHHSRSRRGLTLGGGGSIQLSDQGLLSSQPTDEFIGWIGPLFGADFEVAHTWERNSAPGVRAVTFGSRPGLSTTLFGVFAAELPAEWTFLVQTRRGTPLTVGVRIGSTAVILDGGIETVTFYGGMTVGGHWGWLGPEE